MSRRVQINHHQSLANGTDGWNEVLADASGEETEYHFIAEAKGLMPDLEHEVEFLLVELVVGHRQVNDITEQVGFHVGIDVQDSLHALVENLAAVALTDLFQNRLREHVIA